MLYDIEVRPGPNTEYFQYYTETVEAATSHDAVARVQRSNPGCTVRCCKSYNKSNDSGSSEDNQIDGAGALGLAVIVFAILAWKYLIIIGALAAVVWLVLSAFKE